MFTKNKKMVSTIGIVMLIAIVLCVTLVGCNTNTSPTLANDFSAVVENTEHIKLNMSEASPQSSPNSVNKTITATVLPAAAENKLVDWSVEWADSANTKNVSEYVTVTPTSNGSTTATVSCYKAFTGEIVVTVTTRESGYQAFCNVKFVGIPSTISVTGGVAPTSANRYDLAIGKSFTYDIASANIFNNVGSEYKTITASLTGVGSFKTGYMEQYVSSGNKKWYENNIKTVTLDSLKDEFIGISLAGSKLTVTTKKSIESYYTERERLDGGRTYGYSDMFKEYVSECYFKITLTETKSGVKKDMLIYFDEDAVVGVSANATELIF